MFLLSEYMKVAKKRRKEPRERKRKNLVLHAAVVRVH